MEVLIYLFHADLMAYSAVVPTSVHSYLNASQDVLLLIYVAFVEYGHQISHTCHVHSYCLEIIFRTKYVVIFINCLCIHFHVPSETGVPNSCRDFVFGKQINTRICTIWKLFHWSMYFTVNCQLI